MGAVTKHGHSGHKSDPSDERFDPYGREYDPCGHGFDPSTCPLDPICGVDPCMSNLNPLKAKSKV